MNILFAEDDESLGKLIYHLLKKEFHRVDWVKDGQIAYDYAMFTDYDVVILDWMMPVQNGMETCKKLRKKGFKGGIIFLTARDSLEDVVTGLDTGADDYIIKPFKFEELAARIRALTRRAEKPFEEILSFKDIHLDLNTHVVKRDEEIIELSKKEYELLELLMRNHHQILTREILFDRIWGCEADVTENALDALVKLVRKKIDLPGEPSVIKNVRGVGYKLRNSDGN